MSLVPGLSHNIRQQQTPIDVDYDDVTVEVVDGDDEDIPVSKAGKVLEIQHGDGSVTVSLDGSSLMNEQDDERPAGWFDNLVNKIDEHELGRISDELLRGIDNDIESRRDWIEDRTNGLKLLGLKIEIPGIGGSADGAPVEGMSKVRHPLLLEAVLRFQANARGEFLPTDGPCKIRNDDNDATLAEDQLANALEKDLNHFLTTTASEYYPDTDRMMLLLGFGGTSFKKVYFCPLRNRPVSETVDADDLIVNNSATDLKNAKRITHRSMQRPSTVKRLQILGVYKDTALPDPNQPILDSLQLEKKSQQGVAPDTMNPEDRDREIYEVCCELNVKGHEHKLRGRETGLEIPYIVTIDVSSKQILAITRNYDEDKTALPEARQRFVKYTYIPGLGFYDIGLLHILGNTTNAVTAAWRELLDAGMYANFPGFLVADTGGRQQTNLFRVPPGGGAQVKTGGMPIGDAIMPLPYKEPSPALMQLVENIVETGMRVGSTSEQPIAEGRADAPVGTTLALIEQAQKIISSAHKRIHTAQSTELELIAECFRENPESFWQRNRRPAYKWDEQTFRQALDDYDLIPRADPNTASHIQRIMKVVALLQLTANDPSYDQTKVKDQAIKTLGFSNPDEFKATNPQLPPQIQKGIADAQNQTTMSQARMIEAQSSAKKVDADIANDQQKNQMTGAMDAEKLKLEKERTEDARNKTAAEIEDDKKGRLFKERIELIDTAQTLAVHPLSAPLVGPLLRPAIDDLDAEHSPAGSGLASGIPGSGQ